MKKVYITMLIIIAMIIMIPMKVSAESFKQGIKLGDSSGGSTSSIIDPDVYDPDKYGDDDASELTERASVILGAVRGIGTLVSVIVLMIIGIKTMTASVSEKAVYKQALPGYVLGAIMVFAVTWLPTLLYKLAQQL